MGIKATVLASGSDGNCYLLTGGNKTKILIECGIPYKEIQKGCGFKLGEIDVCLISHEH